MHHSTELDNVDEIGPISNRRMKYFKCWKFKAGVYDAFDSSTSKCHCLNHLSVMDIKLNQQQSKCLGLPWIIVNVAR